MDAYEFHMAAMNSKEQPVRSFLIERVPEIRTLESLEELEELKLEDLHHLGSKQIVLINYQANLARHQNIKRHNYEPSELITYLQSRYGADKVIEYQSIRGARPGTVGNIFWPFGIDVASSGEDALKLPLIHIHLNVKIPRK